MRKENRKAKVKKQSNSALEFSISDRVDILFSARIKQKNNFNIPIRIIKAKKIVIDFEQEKEITLPIVQKNSFKKEFRKLFFGVLNSYFRLLSKTIVLFLIFAINWVAISNIGKTFAYYNDIGTSEGNYIAASNLNFRLYSDNDFEPKLTPTEKSFREIIVTNNGDMDMDYRAHVSVNDNVLCDNIHLRMKMNGLNIYDNDLNDFSLHGLGLSSGESDKLNFELSLDNGDNELWSKECNFSFIFKGIQADVNGFSDRESIRNLAQTGIWEIEDDDSECRRRIRERCHGNKICEKLISCHKKCDKLGDLFDDIKDTFDEKSGDFNCDILEGKHCDNKKHTEENCEEACDKKTDECVLGESNSHENGSGVEQDCSENSEGMRDGTGDNGRQDEEQGENQSGAVEESNNAEEAPGSDLDEGQQDEELGGFQNDEPSDGREQDGAQDTLDIEDAGQKDEGLDKEQDGDVVDGVGDESEDNDNQDEDVIGDSGDSNDDNNQSEEETNSDEEQSDEAGETQATKNEESKTVEEKDDFVELPKVEIEKVVVIEEPAVIPNDSNDTENNEEKE